MNKGELYSEISQAHQKDDAAETVKIFENLFNWESDGSDALLDIGCGDGFVTYNYIAASVPSTIKIIAIDRCNDMIKSARKNYESENLKFYIMNVEEEIVGDLLKPESFNVITTFVAFQYVENLKKAFDSIYKLLKKNGKLVLSVLLSSPLAAAFHALNRTGKYKHIKFGYNKSSMFTNSVDLISFPALLESAGFKITHKESRKRVYTFKDLDEYKKILVSLSIFSAADATDEFMRDYGSFFEDLNVVFDILFISAVKE